jgi:HD-like signal output (HDOD) protein
MSIELDSLQSQAALKGITIPARPALLREIEAMLASDRVDARQVADRVMRDVAIAGAVLKTVNSPMFSLKSKCPSVPMAVQVLGMRNIATLVRALALRQFANGGSGAMSLERFWDASEKVAALSAFVSTKLPRVSREDAYSFGLFRDAGIPMMLQRWPDYRETLRAADNERHGTHHASLGYLLARSWGLSDPVSEGIRHHHELTLFADDSARLAGSAMTLIAINCIAEHLHDARRMRGNSEWERHGAAILDYLGLSAGEFNDLQEEVAQMTV